MKRETRTDFVGTFVAYIYDDGHVETDPPGRPISREDAQRQRRLELTNLRPGDELAAAKAGRSAPAAVLDQAVAGNALAVTLRPFYATQAAMATLAATGRADPTDVRTLTQTVDLGD